MRRSLLAACHASIANTYRNTAMAHAFRKTNAANVVTGSFTHAAARGDCARAGFHLRATLTRAAGPNPGLRAEARDLLGKLR